MQITKVPQKPFPSYKWRWAVLTPTESLNAPPVFLGVLRVFNKYQNYAPSSEEIRFALEVVQKETNSKVNLVRNQDRNLIRNSGQYWKALGLLEETHGKVIVSPFGRLLAEGKITQVEFATTVIKTLELPNRRIASDAADWDKARLTIKPLQLILEILIVIAKEFGSSEAYISPLELVKVVIPLAGAKASKIEHANAIVQFRKGLIDISTWPDCATNSNDKRMAREFLIFLSNYGFCKKVQVGSGNENERYFLASISKEEILELHNLKIIHHNLEEIVREIRITQIPAIVERKRVSREVLERPYQHLFRKNILSAFGFTCIITGVGIDSVLEASHIRPVSEEGSDQIENGLCLRSDIHQLYDSGHLRLLPSGEILLSEVAGTANNYGSLPSEIKIPDFVNREHLEWRNNYY